MVRHRGGQGLLGEAGQAMCSCSPPTDFLWVGGDKSRDQEDAYPKGRGPSNIWFWPTEGEDERDASSLRLGNKGLGFFCDLAGPWFRDSPYVLRR